MNIKHALRSLLLVTIIFLSGCANKKTVEEEVDTFLKTEFTEPDIYFEAALENFQQNDPEAIIENINDVIYFINGLNVEADTANNAILNFAISELEELQEKLQNGEIEDDEEIQRTFSGVDGAIASYHLAIVEDYYSEGGENKEGLERLFRALVRIDYVMKYQRYEMTDEEKLKIETLQKLINQSEKTTPKLLKRVRDALKELNEKSKAPGSKGWS